MNVLAELHQEHDLKVRVGPFIEACGLNEGTVLGDNHVLTRFLRVLAALARVFKPLKQTGLL